MIHGPHSASAAIRSGPSTVPVGLAGELIRMALVRGVTRARTTSGLNWNASSSSTGT